MKSVKLSGIAAFVLNVLLYSCEKDTSNTFRRRVTDRGRSTVKINPSLTATFNPDPATVNQPVTVTGTFDGATAIPDCGKLQLFQGDAGGVTWDKVADADISSSLHAVAYTFTPTIAGDDVYEYYVHFVRSGGCDVFSENKSESYFLEVQNQCVSVFTINPSISAENLGNGLYEFTVGYTLISSVDVTGSSSRAGQQQVGM
jgi:hypothetical protein